MRQHSKLLRALVICLPFSPACLLVVLIIKWGGDVPYWDQWEYVAFFDKLAKGSLSVKDLFAQQNEYRQFFPNLIFVALGRLTKWDVRYEMLGMFLLACLVSFNIFRLGRLTVGGDRVREWSLFFLANLLIFSPVQYENWLFGVQIVYFMPVACITTSLVIARSRLGAGVKLLACMMLATVSTFSSANGILCWIVVFPALALSDGWRESLKKKSIALVWIAGFVLAMAVYFYDYQKPLHHPRLSELVRHPAEALLYFLSFSGSPLGLGNVIFLNAPAGLRHVIAAAVAGTLVIGFFIILSVYISRRAGDLNLARQTIGWLMLGAYSVLTGAMITLGRLGFGLEQSLSSRYTTFSLYLAVSLIYLVAITSEHCSPESRFAGKKKLILLSLAGVLVLSQLLVYPVGIRQMSAHRATLLQGKACLLFINSVPEEECLSKKVYDIDFARLKERANTLDGLGLLRPGLIKNDVAQNIEGTGEPGRSYGSFDTLTKAGRDVYVASGWAVSPDRSEPADAILLTYETGDGKSVVFALADTGDEKGFLRRLIKKDWHVDNARWEKKFALDNVRANPAIINAWSFDARTGKAYRLDGGHIIQNPDK